MSDATLAEVDPEIHELCQAEARRQDRQIRLIASENYASRAVMEATGSALTNKYSEGYPGKRYYEGQDYIDQVENLAIERAKQVFGAEHANVQPYSGSPANLAAYTALMEPGETLLGMALPAGGHLTHGWKVSATSRFWNAVQYGVSEETHRIDYDEVARQAREHRPSVIVCGISAYPRAIDFERFRAIADEVGAWLVADIAHISGLVAGGVHPDPVPYADVVTTTTHKTLRGPRGGLILCRDSVAKKIDRAVFPRLQGGPHNHTTAALAVALREASTDGFREYAQQVVDNARTFSESLKEEGFEIVTGGTDNHIVLMDATPRGISGKELATAMSRAGLIANPNNIPFDPRPPKDPSGIRLGTPSLTSRGMGAEQMKQVARWMSRIAEAPDDGATLERIGEEADALCRDFPAPAVSS